MSSYKKIKEILWTCPRCRRIKLHTLLIKNAAKLKVKCKDCKYFLNRNWKVNNKSKEYMDTHSKKLKYLQEKYGNLLYNTILMKEYKLSKEENSSK